MTFSRRRLVLIGGGLAALVVVVVVVGLALARGGNDSPRQPGRIAVRNGCGLLHMWSDGTDQRDMCLNDIWSAVSLSWNGKHLAWDTRAEGQEIMIGSGDGSGAHSVPVPLGTTVDPSLSPDGDKVALLHSARDDGRYDVWVGSTSIDNAEQLTSTRNVSTVAWSPKGDWIAYVKAWSPDTLEGQIALVRPNGSDERDLVAGDVFVWVPSGKELAYFHDGGIWTVARDGSDPRLVVRDGHAPAWSRDGKQIAFLRAEKCGKPVCKERVQLVFVDGSGLRTIGPKFSDPSQVLWLRDPNE